MLFSHIPLVGCLARPQMKRMCSVVVQLDVLEWVARGGSTDLKGKVKEIGGRGREVETGRSGLYSQ